MTVNKFHLNGTIVACNKCDGPCQTSADIAGCTRKKSLYLQNVKAPAAEPFIWRNGTAPIAKIFIDDLTEQKRLWRMPWFIIVTCCVQVSIFYIATGCINNRLMFIPGHSNDYWRYITYTLLHSDLIHLLLNISLQCLTGFCLESEQGHWQVATIYAVGGVSGSLATAYAQPELSLLGASASVYALLASHVPHLVKNFRQLPYRYLRIAVLLILCLSDAGFTTYHYLVNRNSNPRICVEAHIAGGVAGLCFGFLLYSDVKGQGCGADCRWSNV